MYLVESDPSLGMCTSTEHWVICVPQTKEAIGSS